MRSTLFADMRTVSARVVADELARIQRLIKAGLRNAVEQMKKEDVDNAPDSAPP